MIRPNKLFLLIFLTITFLAGLFIGLIGNKARAALSKISSFASTRTDLVQSKAAENSKRSFDKLGRLVSDPKKSEVPCPEQGKSVGVLLVAGQSNSSNSLQGLFTTKYPWNVVNYFGGKCYSAASPLLGAENEKGEFITPLADALISNGTFSHVVIIPLGIGGSTVSQWKDGGELNQMAIETVKEAKNKYNVTDVIWHQGESDFIRSTDAENYVNDFKSFQMSLHNNGVNAPIYMSIATRCMHKNRHKLEWYKDNEIAKAQKKLIDNKTIFLGVNTDDLLTQEDRYDRCHFSEIGQLKVAASLATSIMRTREKNSRAKNE